MIPAAQITQWRSIAPWPDDIQVEDVFDLWLAINQTEFDIPKTIQIFEEYMRKEGSTITREIFERNINLKLNENSFMDDIGPLFSPALKQTHATLLMTLSGENFTLLNGERMSSTGWSLVDAADEIKKTILVHLPK